MTRNVYRLTDANNFSYAGKFAANDLLHVVFDSADTAVSIAHGARLVRVTSVNGSGVPTGFAIVNEGGYFSRSGGAINMGWGKMLGGTGGGVATFLGTANSLIGNIVPDSNPHPTAFRLLMIGQSNIANYGSASDSYAAPANVTRFNAGFTGTAANSPAGYGGSVATGTAGNLDGRIGAQVLSRGMSTFVDIMNVAVGGTSLAQWTTDASPSAYSKRSDDLFAYTNGKLCERIITAARVAHNCDFKFTHVMLHIGETDATLGTSSASFQASFTAVRAHLRALNINAPIFVGRTSWVNGATHSNIISGQNGCINAFGDVYAGPNTDTLSGQRHDGLHFNVTGLNSAATLWVNSLQSPANYV